MLFPGTVSGPIFAPAAGEHPVLLPMSLSLVFGDPLMRGIPSRSFRAVALTALALVAACGDGPTAPGLQPQITNLTDAFSYQVTSIQGFTGTYTYTWQNTGTVALVSHSSDAGATGTATVVVRDAAGTQVYSGQMVSSGQPATSPAGIAGAWTINVVYSNYSNTQVNFGVLKQ